MSGTRKPEARQTQPEEPQKARQPAGSQPDATDSPMPGAAPGSDEALEQGYSGTAVDPTPNENYTLQGQLAGKPTPETADVKGFGEHREPPQAKPKAATDDTTAG